MVGVDCGAAFGVGWGAAGVGLGMELADAVVACDERGGGHVKEEAVLDDADDGADVGGGAFGVGDGAAGAGEDVVVLVGEVGAAVGQFAEGGVEAEIGELALDEGEGHLDDLDGEGKAAEGGDELGGVDDDDEATGGAGDDFFAEESAAAAFDEGELRADLVGAIDVEVELGELGEGEDVDAEAGGEVVAGVG